MSRSSQMIESLSNPERFTCVPSQSSAGRTCGYVPQPHGAIGAAGGQGSAVGAERHRNHRAGVAGYGFGGN
jgi:hypothetical protein